MLIITQFVISLLLLSSSGLPTRGPTSGTGSDGGRTGNSTRDNCDIELNSKQIETLVSTIQETLNGLFRILQRVRLWNSAVMCNYVRTYMFSDKSALFAILHVFA